MRSLLQTDEPDDEDYIEDGSAEPDDLEKNLNAVNIHQAEKEKREKAKLENQKKKERDKMERYLSGCYYEIFKLW